MLSGESKNMSLSGVTVPFLCAPDEPDMYYSLLAAVWEFETVCRSFLIRKPPSYHIWVTGLVLHQD